MVEQGRGTPFVSRAVQATKESSSLRVTIPQVVATTLGLRPGDEILWFVDPQSGAVRIERQPAPEPPMATPPPEPHTAETDTTEDSSAVP